MSESKKPTIENLEDHVASSEAWGWQHSAFAQEAIEAEKEKKAAHIASVVRTRIIYFISINMIIAVLLLCADLFNPGSVKAVFQNDSILYLNLAIYVCGVLLLILLPIPRLGSGSFSEIDRRYQDQSKRSSEIDKLSEERIEQIVDKKINQLSQDVAGALDEASAYFDSPSESASSLKCELYLKQIIKDLEAQIALSEEKASALLDKGLNILGMGLFFYIATIIGWQMWGRGEELTGLLIVGMLSCTVAFIVIEFLAAWCLKQYRGFIDSALSYTRVKSHYDRCLLSYYAVKEVPAHDSSVSLQRAEFLKLLASEAKWPDIKQVNANDFNFMLESMGSMTALIDKMRGMLAKPETKNNGGA